VITIHTPGSVLGATFDATRWYRPRQIALVSERVGWVHPSLATPARRLDLVREYGDFSIAYTTAVQDRLKHFGDHRGYLAYDRRMGYTFALGDPVAPPRERERILRRFVQQHRNVAFCQISRATAEIVQRCNFYVNELGVDSVLPLTEYDFSGQDKRWLRVAASWISRRGYTICEETAENVGLDQIESVSLAWRATRAVKRKEVRFLNRPLVLADEPETRRFYLFDDQRQLLAFVFFDPLFRDGRLLGYVACSKRRHPDAPPYAEHAIMKHAIETFQREGCQEFRLGLSPLAHIEDREFGASWFVSRAFRSAFESRLINRRFYNVQGHAEYKRRFRGREEKVYFATRSRLDPLQLAALVKICKVV
jgi:lysylphosphatidylglycerol synthetase-like protein (DUF2156 family)